MVTGFYPKTVKEALALKKKYPNALLVAGGSDVMTGKKKAERVIFLNQIQKIKSVVLEDTILRIGAGNTYHELLKKPEVPELLKKTIRNIASPAVRNVGTMTGNICNASPAGDTLPVLYALDAKVVKASMDETGYVKEEKVPIESFILGIRKVDLKPEEMVVAVELEKENFESMTRVYYQKVGARQAEAISKLSFAALLKTDQDVITDIRIAFGSVGITVVRKKELEERIKGLSVAQLLEKKEEIVKWYEEILHPIDDQRSTAAYRKKVCLNLLDDFLSL